MSRKGSSETQKKSPEDSSKGVATSVLAEGPSSQLKDNRGLWHVPSPIAEDAPPPRPAAPQYSQSWLAPPMPAPPPPCMPAPVLKEHADALLQERRNRHDRVTGARSSLQVTKKRLFKTI